MFNCFFSGAYMWLIAKGRMRNSLDLIVRRFRGQSQLL
jgi:hypothetical protein